MSIQKYFLIVLNLVLMPSSLATMSVEFCKGLQYRWITDPIKAISSLPQYSSHPYYTKVRLSLGDPTYNFMQELHASTLVMKAVDGSNILPVSKREPFTRGISAFGHFSVENDTVKYLLPDLSVGDYLMYDMDYYRKEVYRQLRSEYTRQGLPPQAYDSIEMQEFSLAESRKAEIAIVTGGQLVGYVRVYNASNINRFIQENFESSLPADVKRTHLRALNLDQGSWDFSVSPAERLAYALNMENPYDDLRKKFKNMAFIEIGRMYIRRDLEPDQQEAVKRLIWTSAMDVVSQLCDGELNNAMLIASAGPFGARYYPKTYNFHLVATKKIKDIRDLQLRPAPGGENFPVVTLGKDIDEMMNRGSRVDLEQIKPVTFLATSGTELQKALFDQNLLLNNYPTTLNMATAEETEILPWVKPLPNDRYQTTSTDR